MVLENCGRRRRLRDLCLGIAAVEDLFLLVRVRDHAVRVDWE